MIRKGKDILKRMQILDRSARWNMKLCYDDHQIVVFVVVVFEVVVIAVVVFMVVMFIVIVFVSLS